MPPRQLPRPKLLGRAAALLVALAAGAAGCDTGGPPDDFVYPATVPYPPRTDPILVNRPTISPSRFNDPGTFPLQVLDLSAGDLTGDALALRQEVTQKKAALDPRKLGNPERAQLAEALAKRFGTPGAPKVAGFGQVKAEAGPVEEAAFVAELRLGPEELARGSALFRQNCLKCHGLTGDGHGPAAASALPSPRDYRQGVFKYTTVARPDGVRRPSRHDLREVIDRGVPGAWMPSFVFLRAADRDALVSYVIHLSFRGEVETAVLRAALADELDSTLENEVKSAVERLGGYWYDSQHRPVEPGPDPYRDSPERQLAAAAKGYRVFMDGQQGGCAACHTNLGRTAPYYYDVWGTIVRPRNLTEGQFRGGPDPDDLYCRLFCGIGAAGMPAFEVLRPKDAEKEKGEDRLWQLVHFVRTVSSPRGRAELRAKYQIEFD
jgi:mono/diheme cytochrome c family protein